VTTTRITSEGAAWENALALATPLERVQLEAKRGALAIAVPAWVDRYEGADAETLLGRGKVIAARLREPGMGEAGPVLIPRYTTAAFALLAEGLAILAYSPGGVVLYGLRFEALPPARPRAPEVTPRDVGMS
jgi:hypothetical protein